MSSYVGSTPSIYSRAPARRAPRRGRGFFDSVLSVAKPIAQSGAIGNLAGLANPKLGGVLKAVGLGRRRRAPRRRGAGFLDSLGSVGKALLPALAPIARSGAIGNIAGLINPKLGNATKAVGLGRKRRVRRRAPRMGAGTIGQLLGTAGALAGAFGLGRKRRVRRRM